jgi:hypothetical protein
LNCSAGQYVSMDRRSAARERETGNAKARASGVLQFCKYRLSGLEVRQQIRLVVLGKGEFPESRSFRELRSPL